MSYSMFGIFLFGFGVPALFLNRLLFHGYNRPVDTLPLLSGAGTWLIHSVAFALILVAVAIGSTLESDRSYLTSIPLTLAVCLEVGPSAISLCCRCKHICCKSKEKERGTAIVPVTSNTHTISVNSQNDLGEPSDTMLPPTLAQDEGHMFLARQAQQTQPTHQQQSQPIASTCDCSCKIISLRVHIWLPIVVFVLLPGVSITVAWYWSLAGALLLFCGFTGAACAGLLYMKPQELSNEYKQEMNPIQSLHSDFKSKFWFWELIEFEKRLALTALVALLSEHSHGRIMASFVICFVFLILHTRLLPLDDGEDGNYWCCSFVKYVVRPNVVQGISLVSLAAVYLCGILIKLEDGIDSEEVHDSSINRFNALLVDAMLISALVIELVCFLLVSLSECCNSPEEEEEEIIERDKRDTKNTMESQIGAKAGDKAGRIVEG